MLNEGKFINKKCESFGMSDGEPFVHTYIVSLIKYLASFLPLGTLKKSEQRAN